MDFQPRKITDRVQSVSTAEVIMVKSLEGSGTPNDPLCPILTYWTTDGVKIGEVNPLKQTDNPTQHTL